MSIVTITSSRLAGSAGRTVAINPLLAALARFRQEWTYFRARQAMGALDEASLHDLGVSRSEIDAVVRHGRVQATR